MHDRTDPGTAYWRRRITEEIGELLPFLRARLAERDDPVLRQTIGLYEQAMEMAEPIGHMTGDSFVVAAESYANVLLVFAAQHAGHREYQARWHRGWMDELDASR